jgi:hypothetical protein
MADPPKLLKSLDFGVRPVPLPAPGAEMGGDFWAFKGPSKKI